MELLRLRLLSQAVSKSVTLGLVTSTNTSFIQLLLYEYLDFILFQMIREADADGDGKVGYSISVENINCSPRYPNFCPLKQDIQFYRT